MDIRIEDASVLEEYSKITPAFRVDSVLKTTSHGMRGIELSEEKVDTPYIKQNEDPMEWLVNHDISDWVFVTARDFNGVIVGGIASTNVQIFNDEKSLICHDHRILPEYRRSGVGQATAAAYYTWALAQGVTQLIWQTQNTNVPACKFASEQLGATLVGISVKAYSDSPDEVQLLWSMDKDDMQRVIGRLAGN